MTKVKINGKNYNVKYTIRALFIFERIAQHSYQIESLLDNYVLLYSVLLANNPDMTMTWDDFINEIDKDPTLFTRINAAIDKDNKKNEVFSDSEADTKEGDKEEKKD